MEFNSNNGTNKTLLNILIFAVVLIIFLVICLIFSIQKNRSDSSPVVQPNSSYSYNDTSSDNSSYSKDNSSESTKSSEDSSDLSSIIESAEKSEDGQQRDYVLSTKTKKFHLPSCSSTKKLKDSNRQDVHTTRDNLIDQGYSACKKCCP